MTNTAALEPSTGTDTPDRLARRWLKAFVTAPTPARAVYAAGEHVGLLADDIKAGIRGTGLTYVRIDDTWWIRPKTTAERDAAKRAALARHWRR
jgi:hypothetical protein